jgi:CheY-like chemotaxis protein
LLADDSVTIRKVIELTFADEGIDVTTVADGAAAMTKFVEIEPDIVLVDVGLPGTNGYHICEMIKGDESTSRIPVLLLVGSFEPFDQDAAEQAGADGFLTKPFHSIRELVNRVHDLLGQPVSDPDDTIAATSGDENPSDDSQDINELYERSFAETQPIENYETIPAFDQPEGFAGEVNDDLPTVDVSHHSVEEWLDDEMIETVSGNSSSASGPETGEQGAEGPLDADAAPDTIESSPGPDGDSGSYSGDVQEESFPQEDAVEAVGEYENAPAAVVDIEPIKEFDWSPAAIVTSADESKIGAAAGFAPAFVPEESFIPPGLVSAEQVPDEPPPLDTDETTNSEPTTDGSEAGTFPIQQLPADDETPFDQPSREFIDLVARRVIERLSDRAIREIAQEAVPRIAEKLMREALEEERNK